MVAPFSITWVVDAPWAHPVWGQYLVSLVDLTTDTGTPPKLYMQGATHEVLVFALDPNHPAPTGIITDMRQLGAAKVLEPVNHAYQFTAANDEEAAAYILAVVELIKQRRLNPDTDAHAQWNQMFYDGVSLKE